MEEFVEGEIVREEREREGEKNGSEEVAELAIARKRRRE